MYFGDHELIETGTRDCEIRDCEIRDWENISAVVFSFINAELIISRK